MKNFKEDLDKALRRCIEEKGMTERDIAYELRLPVPTVIRWIEKKNYPHELMIDNLVLTLDQLKK